MKTRWALLAGAALGACILLPSAARAQGRGPFADVPQSHWAYDAVSQLAQRGIFTGYPDGTFSGRRALTRYEFAVALQRLLQDVQRKIDAVQTKQGDRGPAGEAGAKGDAGPPGLTGPPGPPGVSPAELAELRRNQQLMRSDITNLQRLAQEFSSELAMLGTDVEQIKRNLAALTDRVARLEGKVARMPVITGSVNIGFRGAATGVSNPGPTGSTLTTFARPNVAAIPSGVNPGVVDRDGRLLNPSKNILDRVNAFYDIDLGVTANISDVATARLLLNAGNYLFGYLNGRISQVNPLIENAVEGKGSVSNNGFGSRFTAENVTPYYLYLETPLKIAGIGTQLTVGKFGHQFTPYTLKMADVDSYFYNDKTDLGDYPIAGGRASFRMGNANIVAYAGVHDTNYAQLTSTAGFVVPGVYAGGVGGDFFKFQPQGSNGPFLAVGSPYEARFGGFSGGTGTGTGALPGGSSIGVGSTSLNQSAGLRATYTAKRFQVGGTFVAAAGNSANADGFGSTSALSVGNTSDAFRQLNVAGLDASFDVWRGIVISGAFTETWWNSRGFGDVAHSWLGGINESDRQAIDLRVSGPIKSAKLTGYYKRIGEAFDAPGYWGRMGNWINPRGIEGFGGMLEIPLMRRVVFEAEGADYRYQAFHRAGVPGSDLFYVRGGFRFPMSAKNSVDVGYERVDWNPDDPGGAPISTKRLEQYYNVGFNHQFSPGLSWRVMYQFMAETSRGQFELPGFRYQAGILATQFMARF